MEPTQEQIVYHTTISQVSPLSNWFRLTGVQDRFWIDCPELRPGDRVKITITKEPADAPGQLINT